ncbi:dihydroorotate dehydrogenase electron transfer subunit [Butyrivibrio sp. INlla16]|uniref:dihydroorotate dehydrogenase electron transfer subunit n=1 Tax=Butyrivibrio sp. INlla16 TaxID=1520807 RepID=UPI00088FC445|nr:dihydroorotate dehydrogenase electron transfer subunit [Butyrivibrio sp. INlla16]SDB64895.1 dihydroorotate dehydrogenase electron transfer subunit [Butyrivibrio sp. INlla16]
MSKKKKIDAVVLEQRVLADGIMDITIETSLAEDANPGQFVGIYPKNKSTLLPRPISICEYDRENGKLRIVYRIAGSGTAEFALYQPGESISILGILGNGFPLDKAEGKRVLIIGGGIGVPPLLGLSKALHEGNEGVKAGSVTMVMGYRNSDNFLADEFKKYGNLLIATEDGSVGTKGNVIDACRENKVQADIIYACGPMPMLRGVAAYAAEIGAKAYISLEERMACGVGACLGCICKTKNIDEHSHVNNARICTDGPVFDADDLEL